MNCNKQIYTDQYMNERNNNTLVNEYGLFLVDGLFISNGWIRKTSKNTECVIIQYFKNELNEFRIKIMKDEVEVLVPIKNSNNSYKTTFFKKKDSMFSVSEYLEMHLLEFKSKH